MFGAVSERIVYTIVNIGNTAAKFPMISGLAGGNAVFGAPGTILRLAGCVIRAFGQRIIGAVFFGATAVVPVISAIAFCELI